MFDFLFGKKTKAPEPKPETQRETLVRAQGEINKILRELTPKPSITINPEEGSFSIQLPEMMPDELKALPGPAKLMEKLVPRQT
jgi:hypothetical protein